MNCDVQNSEPRPPSGFDIETLAQFYVNHFFTLCSSPIAMRSATQVIWLSDEAVVLCIVVTGAHVLSILAAQ